jgi:hypothetical protein
MHPVGGQQDQYDEIRNKQGDIERIRAVEALEGPVKKVLPDIRANPLVGKEGKKRCQVRNEQTSQPDAL